MFQELAMENVWLSVPFLVLSTEVDGGGQIKKHLVTPFGYIDLLFPTPSSGDHHNSPYVVTVTGDFLRCYEFGPDEFKWSFARYVREIAESYLGSLGIPSERLRIRFPNEMEETDDFVSELPTNGSSYRFPSASLKPKDNM